MNMGGYQYQNHGPEEKLLKMKIPPSNFSGPAHLKRLVGKCFSLTDSSYKYDVCPFSNITQHEQSLRWNPYSGILGVWQEWEIVNNTFHAMVMNYGDTCGSKTRSCKIYFFCGNETKVVKVEEPSKCNYAVHLNTPLVCHPHSMLVYPTLSVDHRDEWDILEGQYQNEEFTKEGYNYKLRQIFVKAGYCVSETLKAERTATANQADQKQYKLENGEFDTLDKCSEEYKKIKDQLKNLKSLLEVNGINPDNDEREALHRQEEELQHQQQHMEQYDHHV